MIVFVCPSVTYRRFVLFATKEIVFPLISGVIKLVFTGVPPIEIPILASYAIPSVSVGKF